MTDLPALLELKARLPRTWPAFFARYGSFTATQIAAIPPLLAGESVLLCAPTASGKTAAVLAPLVERYCPPLRAADQLRILYLTPTRALVNDLQSRLLPALEPLAVRLAVKTRDSSLRSKYAPDILLATPESLDSLLTSKARLFMHVQAVVIDEMHLFVGTARGDQLRVLLNRIRRIRAYAAAQGETDARPLQLVALSATSDAGSSISYAPAMRVVQIAGARRLHAEHYALAPDDIAALRAYLESFARRGWRKALVFCNSRSEVEAYAAAIRERSPFGSAVYVHYSNLEPQRRRAIESEYAAREVAICFSSSTLELGIDIGSIDVVILIGPPGNSASFAQRIGRGNRRAEHTRVACFYRSPLEELLFEALIADLEAEQPQQAARAPAPFRPSVAIQQIFSLIKQSPTAAVRPAELYELFAGMLSAADLDDILAELRRRDYLKEGRPGEWRAGLRLNKLYDEQNSKQVSLSIYSNIQISDARLIEVRDQHSGELVAQVESSWLAREQLTLEGRPIDVQWYDGEALWVASAQRQDASREAIYRSSRQLLSYELAQLLPTQLGLEAGQAALLAAAEGGYYLFHWLGDLYGRALMDLLAYKLPVRSTELPGIALHLPEAIAALPAWDAQIERYLRDSYRAYEPLLELGAFQLMLPVNLRRRTVIEHFNLSRFLEATASMRLATASEYVAGRLEELLLS